MMSAHTSLCVALLSTGARNLARTTLLTATTMSASGEMDYDSDHLSVLIDDGGSSGKVTAELFLPSCDMVNKTIDVVRLRTGQDTLEQQCVILDDIDEDGDPCLLYGDHEVSTWLRANPTEGHRVIENSPLAFYQQYSDSAETRRFYRALGSEVGDLGALQKFTTLRYKWIFRRIVRYYRDQTMMTIKHRDLDWVKLPKAVKLTVPAINNNVMHGIYKNAAVDNGLRNVQLRLEPCCAAANDVELLLKHNAVAYRDTAVWYDIGHFTNDLAAIRIDEPLREGEQARLTIAHPPSGYLHGSHVVRKMALEYVLGCPEVVYHGGIDSVPTKLGGMSQEELARQVSALVERPKTEIPRDFAITICSRNDKLLSVPGAGGMRVFPIIITADRMQSWLDAWARDVVRDLVAFMEAPSLRNTLMVVLTGGGSSNDTVSKALGASGQRRGIDVRLSQSDMAVARGGHAQYPRNEASALGYGLWYLSRSEPLQKARHRDAYLASNKRERNPKLVTQSMDGDGWYAKDRVVLALKRLPNEPKRTWRIPMEFPIALPNGSLEFKIYFSDKQRRNGGPLLDRQGDARDIYQPYQVQLANLDVDWSKYEGQLETYLHEGLQRTNLNGFVEMDCNDDEWTLTVTILKPGETLREEDTGVVIATNRPSLASTYHVLIKQTRHIWDKHRTVDITDGLPTVLPTEESSSRKRRSESPSTPRTPMVTRRMKAEQVLLSSFDEDSTASTSTAQPSTGALLYDSSSATTPVPAPKVSSPSTFAPPVERPGPVGRGYGSAHMPNWSVASDEERVQWLRQQGIIGRPTPVRQPAQSSRGTASSAHIRRPSIEQPSR